MDEFRKTKTVILNWKYGYRLIFFKKNTSLGGYLWSYFHQKKWQFLNVYIFERNDIINLFYAKIKKQRMYFTSKYKNNINMSKGDLFISLIKSTKNRYKSVNNLHMHRPVQKVWWKILEKRKMARPVQ